MNLSKFYKHCRYIEDQLVAFITAESLTGNSAFSDMEVERSVDRIRVSKSTYQYIVIHIKSLDRLVVEKTGFMWSSVDKKNINSLERIKYYLKWNYSDSTISFIDYVKEQENCKIELI